MIARTLFAVFAAYLLGSVPTGLWLGMGLRGIDIRQHGSRNIGATNVMRVLGKRLGAVALLADVAKGLIAAALISRLSPWAYAPLACGLAAVAGHTASIFLRFRGGKGVATSAGVFLALCPMPMLAAIAVFAAIVRATRMVSAGSMIGAVLLAGLLWLTPHEWATWPGRLLPPDAALPVIATAVAALVVFRHRSNLRRILQGTENRI